MIVFSVFIYLKNETEFNLAPKQKNNFEHDYIELNL